MRDPFAILTEHPNRTLGACATLIVVCAVVAAILTSLWPLTVASIPLALAGLTYMANSG